MQIKIVMTLPPDAASVPLVRHTFAEAMRSAGVADDCVDEASVALTEACTNVLHHVGGEDSYEVAVALDAERLTMDILDSGGGVAENDRRRTMPDGSAENGRGLALMAAFSDRVAFDSVLSSGGSVHLMKNLRWTTDAPLRSIDSQS
jgi:serine/threonine-protein kinase RsbW